VLASVHVGIVVPLLDLYHEREARIATDRLLQPRLRGAAAAVPELQARVAELRRTASTRKVTLDGASDALASAALQSRIEALATAAEVAISSTDGVAPEARAGYRRIGLRVSVGGTYDSIVKFLAAIETTSPPLVLDNLQIHGKPVVAGSLAVTRLDAGFEAYGLRSTEAKGAATP
jgi:Tfp pilus assembly protein PilO